MAGEINPATDYELINSGKLVNKAGLLELSKNIKAYVAENAGGGTTYTAGDGISIDNGVIDTKIRFVKLEPQASYQQLNQNTVFKEWVKGLALSKFPDNYMKNYEIGWYGGTVGDIEDKNTASFYGSGITQFITERVYRQFEVYATFQYFIIHLYGKYMNGQGELTDNIITIYYELNTANNEDRIYGFSWGRGYYNKTKIFSSSNDAYLDLKYIQDNYATKAELPSIPASSSTDGSYMLVDTVSNGTSTKSWETVPSSGTSLPTDPSNDGSYVLQNTISSGSSTLSWTTPSSGGGTTYTAGTGIDIDANNEISVDATDLSYNDLQDKPTIPTVPTNISAFTNDAGYLTSHQSLTGYATQNYVDNALSQVPSYSAGTGISINANGVISLDLQNANGVSY